MKKIISIGISIPSINDDFVSLDSLTSISHTDIAIFSPTFSNTSYSTYDDEKFLNDGEHDGKKLYNKESSIDILDHSKHWKSELLNFIQNGGTLILVLSKKEDFYIYNGNKHFNNFFEYSNYNYLPFSELEFNSLHGKNIIPNNAIVKDIYQNFKDYFNFEIHITGNDIIESTFTTKNKDRTLGTNLKIKNGNVVIIPNLDFEIKKFITKNYRSGNTSWNAEANNTGKLLIRCIVEMDAAIRKSQEKTPKPTWLASKEFKLKASDETLDLLDQNKKELEKLQDEFEYLNKILEEQESLKDLLFETGKPLEIAVIKALKILGFSAENFDDGDLELDQIIISPEGQRLIGECEGKDNKDIDITKFRQLQDALNADFEREEVEEKAFGLLIGNPQRLTNPVERTLSFTKKCQDGAKREKIGLIKTEDLFEVCRFIQEKNNIEFAKKCRETIIFQLGQIIEFPKTE